LELVFSKEEKLFREEAREWLNTNVPRDRQPEDGAAKRSFDLAWQRAQYEGGWAGIAWPKEYGGRGLSLIEQLIWHEEYAQAGGPYAGSCFVGLNHGGPTLILRGTEAQRSFHLPRILRGEVIWCQGFSEPGAGSDLASLRTRAIVDGDHLVVSGQKIWTSYAHLSDYQELLVRTDPDAPRHKGISWVICDMRTQGIEIRPIKTMSGMWHFCEVFYDEVRIPLGNVVGELNGGWGVAMSTLSFERGTAFIAQQMELAQMIERLIDMARDTPGPDQIRPAIHDDEIARRLAMLRAEVYALRAMVYATVSRALRDGKVGPEGSMMRLYYGLLLQKTQRLAMELRGVDALSFDTTGENWTHRYLHSFKDTISAGTAQIQRNIIGERVLGLPREGRGTR
jgi:alkylation response protein AidB-like acyl-CoA dehydrogenase